MGMLEELAARASAFGRDVERSVVSAKKPPGKVLGGRVVTFTSVGKLGMTVGKDERGLARVTQVEDGPARQHGIKLGDVISMVDGCAVDYTSFLAKAQKRPVSLTVVAQGPAPATEGRDARRDAMAAAAEKRDREKFGAGRGSRGSKSSAVATREREIAEKARRDSAKPLTEQTPETQAAWRRGADRDAATRRELGYDPFKSISTGSTGSSSTSPPLPPPAAEDPGASERRDAALRSASAAVELLLAAYPTKARECVGILLKLLDNAKNGEEKFRRVRCGNAAIQAKVLSVSGGLEALCAAGFALAEEDGETVLLLAENFDAARLKIVAEAIRNSGLGG